MSFCMKILLIILLLLILLLLYPVRLAANFTAAELTVYWLPWPPGQKRVRVFSQKIAPPALLQSVANADWSQVAAIVTAKKPGRTATSPKQRKLLPRLGRAMLRGAAGAVRVRRLSLCAAVGGEPFAAAMLAGGVMSGLHAAMAYASCRVAAWPKPANCRLAVTLLPPPSLLAQSRIAADVEADTGVGAVLAGVAKQLVCR